MGTEVPVKLSEFVVTPSRFGVADVAAPAAASLTAAEIEVLPQLGDDLFRSIARLPGLAADDISAQFWVRGAPHGQLLARLDGVDLIEPFHLKDVEGALSIVDPAMIQRLDLSTGGFTVEYGDRLAGVLTMDTKSSSQPLASLGLSLTGVGGSYQGVYAGGKGRWLASARRGYPDVALRLSDRSNDISPRYYDAFAKVQYDIARGHTLSLHALHSGDGLRYIRKNERPSLTSGYDSDYGWARWQATFGDRLSGETLLSYARLTWKRDGSGRMDNFPFLLRDRRRLELATLRQELTVTASERLVLRGGVEGKTGEARYDYTHQHRYTTARNGIQVTVIDDTSDSLKPDGDSAGVYGAARFQPFDILVVEPGVRFDRTSHTDDRETNPRLNAALSLGKATVRGAWGMYSQAQGLHELSVPDGERTFGRAERAEHTVLGVEYPLGKTIAVRVEAYQRIHTRVRPRWENLDNPYELFPEVESDRALLNPNRGRARGVEILFSSRGGGPVAWHASYALARAEERIAGQWRPRSRDQRHSIYLDTTYRLNPRWQFSAAWQYHTGWPTTDIQYSLAFAGTRRFLVATNGPVYGLRMPDYHRLDLRATRRFALRRGELRAFIDIFNAYDRINVIGYDHDISISGTQVTDVKDAREQLPILPSVGFTWEF